MYSTMRIIIDKIFALEMFDSEMMCKYIRCIYQVALPLEDDMAFQVLEDALKLARDSAKVCYFPNDYTAGKYVPRLTYTSSLVP